MDTAIDIAALIDKLQAFALGSDGSAMSEQQVAAASALMNWVVPDLHSIELRAEGGQPILLTVAETASGDDASTKVAIE